MPVTMDPNSLPRYRCGCIEGVEELTGYRTGGFCPIRIGQMLGSKYEIIAKLGYGGYSTVWLAKDVSVTYDFPAPDLCISC
jgi:serine/threonine protein kinase